MDSFRIWLTEIFSDVGLTLSFLSTVISVIITLMIFKYQKKHEEKLEKETLEQKRRVLENKANNFIMDNNQELEYIPWCVIAANQHKHVKHERKIYTEFCRLTTEVQNEVIKQLKYNIEALPDMNWVDPCMDLLAKDIKEYRLGRDILYDNAKYYHRSFQYYRNLKWNDIDCACDFNPIYKGTWYKPEGNINFDEYVHQYLQYQNREKKPDDLLNFKVNPIAPVDYIWVLYDLSECDEELLCTWEMELVEVA